MRPGLTGVALLKRGHRLGGSGFLFGDTWADPDEAGAQGRAACASGRGLPIPSGGGCSPSKGPTLHPPRDWPPSGQPPQGTKLSLLRAHPLHFQNCNETQVPAGKVQRVTHEEGATPQKNYSSFLIYTDRNRRTCVGMGPRCETQGKEKVGLGCTTQRTCAESHSSCVGTLTA